MPNERTKDGCMQEVVDGAVDDSATILGLIDVTMSSVLTAYPMQEEKDKVRSFVSSLMTHWQKMGLNITLKAHLMEHHLGCFNDDHGVGDKDESFIELQHL